MNKKIYTFLVIGLTLISPKLTFGFLSDPLDLDMYKKIDKGIYDLELKFIERELRGGEMGGSIKDNLNKKMTVLYDKDSKNCFNKELSVSEVGKINNGDVETLYKSISGDCKEKDGEIAIVLLSRLQNVVSVSYDESVESAQKKVDKLYKIGRIGMYSDGVEENSPFDLMVDIENIDKVIFEQKIPYNGVNSENLGMVVGGIYGGLNTKDAIRGAKDKIIFQGKYTDKNYNDDDKKYIDENLVLSDTCKIDNSGLNNDALNSLLGKNTGTGNNLGNNSGAIDPNLLNSSVDGLANGNLGKGYSKVNDNAFWPCNQFFCIVIKFVMYNHNVLGGGKDLSIEGLFKRSNNHLKKMASSFLGQSNMTINIFQMGFKDLDLANVFHLGLNVTRKPVPILNVEPMQEGTQETDGKTKDTSSDEFKVENMLLRYYKNNGLDYKRSNDLSIFGSSEIGQKSIIDAVGTTAVNASDRSLEAEKKIGQMLGENAYISNNIIDKKALFEDMNGFYTQFSELERFTSEIIEYSIGTRGIIKKMDQIPEGS